MHESAPTNSGGASRAASRPCADCGRYDTGAGGAPAPARRAVLDGGRPEGAIGGPWRRRRGARRAWRAGTRPSAGRGRRRSGRSGTWRSATRWARCWPRRRWSAAPPRILEAVGAGLGWDWGAFWEVDQPGTSRGTSAGGRCAASPPGAGPRSAPPSRPRAAGGPSRGAAGCRAASGRSGAPAWVPDVQHDAGFRRAPAAARAGLRGAVAVPVRSGGRVVGVLEFLAREARAPDGAALATLAGIGDKVGQFVARRRAEAALRASEARFRELFDDAPVGYQELDAAGRFVRVNRALCRMLGYDAAELLGRRIWDARAGVGARRAARGDAPHVPGEAGHRRRVDGGRARARAQGRHAAAGAGRRPAGARRGRGASSGCAAPRSTSPPASAPRRSATGSSRPSAPRARRPRRRCASATGSWPSWRTT